MKAVTAKIELPPQTVTEMSTFLSPCSFYFFFPFSFLHLPPAFGLFLSQTTAISLRTFSKIQLDNVLALTVTYALIFVNVPASANTQLSFSKNNNNNNNNNLILILRAFHEMIKRALHDFYL